MLSFQHIVVIVVVALIVLGPEKLPQVVRMLGRAMADLRRITGEFRTQIEDEIQGLERQANSHTDIAAHESDISSALGELPKISESTPKPQAADPPPLEQASAPGVLRAPTSPEPENPNDGESHPA